MKQAQTICECFERFLLFKRAQGLKEKTLESYGANFRAVSKHLNMDVNIQSMPFARGPPYLNIFHSINAIAREVLLVGFFGVIHSNKVIETSNIDERKRDHPKLCVNLHRGVE